MFLIFGLGDGKMDLQLKNLNVSPGDTLEGTASLTMKKDIEGKEVVAILYAEEKVTEHEGKGTSTRNITLYSKSEILDTEKLYTTANSPYQYKFAFVIPQAGASSAHSTSISVGTSNLFRSGIVRWYVKAELKHEAALKFPVAKTQEINIVARGDAHGDVAKTIAGPPEPSTQPLSPETASSGEKFCASCGTQLNPGAAFCSNCGSKQ